MCPGDILQAQVEYRERKKTAVEASMPQCRRKISIFTLAHFTLFPLVSTCQVGFYFTFFLLPSPFSSFFFVISCGFKINVCIKALTWMRIFAILFGDMWDDKLPFHPHFDWLCVNLMKFGNKVHAEPLDILMKKYFDWF